MIKKTVPKRGILFIIPHHERRVSKAMAPVIAALDDEPDILELLRVNLQKAGYRFEGFQEADDLFRYLAREKPSLILLDLMLPDTDGLEVCRHIRRSEGLAAIPIIMLTARGDESDKVVGLELGADDYVTKPFSVKELVARIHAVLRRPGGGEAVRRIVVGTLVIDVDKFEVTAEGAKVDLTATEFKILQLLASRKGRVFSRDQILDFLWGSEKAVIDRTVDVHIRNLREKLGEAAALIKNIRGVGYKLEE
jgi:two-component system phosphate regulon response regulator PhoB/two-component system alkaline phosphatase synthesis response regulator PhoP